MFKMYQVKQIQKNVGKNVYCELAFVADISCEFTGVHAADAYMHKLRAGCKE